MKQIGAPIAEYQRDGSLYLGNFTMSDVVRPGQNSWKADRKSVILTAVMDL